MNAMLKRRVQMFEFMKETWGLFRAETGEGRRLRCPWAVLAFVSVVAFYLVLAPLRALVGWLGRQVNFLRWLQRFEGPAVNIFFSSNRASDAEGVT